MSVMHLLIFAVGLVVFLLMIGALVWVVRFSLRANRVLKQHEHDGTEPGRHAV